MIWENLSRLKGIFLTITALFILYGLSLNVSAATEVTQTGASDTTVTVDWTTDSSAYGYNVYLSSNGSTYSRTTSDSECDVHKDSGTEKKISGLSAGKTYYVKVLPVYKSSSGTVSEGSSLGEISVVTAPSRVKASSIKQTKATDESIKFRWKAVSGATGYIVYVNDKKVGSVTENSATVSVSAGSINTVQVRPYKKSEEGYKAKGGYTEAYDFYAAPGVVTKIASFKYGNLKWQPTVSSKVTVGWNKASGDEYEPTGYKVEIYSVKGKKLKTYFTSKTSKKMSISSIKNAGFKIRVRAYIKINGTKYYGEWSSLKTVIPEAKIKLTRTGSKKLSVKWSKVKNAKKYIVYVCTDIQASKPVWKKAAVVGSDTTSYTIKNCKVGKATAVYVIPVVKVGSKTYKATKTWYLYMNIT